MITFIAHLRVKSENAAAFEALMTYVCAKVHEHEPGVPYYAFAQSVQDPSTYVVIETYSDVAAHTAHMETDWVKQSLPKTVCLIEGRPDIKQYVSPGSAPVRARE